VTVNVLELALPEGVWTVIAPLLAPFGTVVRIVVSLTTVKLASLPLKLTAFALLKPLPVIVTGVPHGPLAGVKLLMVGAGAAVVTV
jgi:hypothetical protein